MRPTPATPLLLVSVLLVPGIWGLAAGIARTSRRIRAVLDQEGVQCGQKRCLNVEYCSPYDTHCRPCSEACDRTSHNYQPRECTRDCQVYLQDRRYVLRSELGQYEDLGGEVGRLRIMMTVSITVTCLSLLAIVYLLGKALIRWDKIGDAFRRALAKSRSKRGNARGVGPRDESDSRGSFAGKQNGKLKLAMPAVSPMPTISATVAPARITPSCATVVSGDTGAPDGSFENRDGSVGHNGPGSGSGNGSGNGNRNGLGNGNGNGNGTPNTTSTPLSRRHPSEDTTLDYAYDNPAMTPSPEAAQLRTKRESSF